jgi:hypothetical protein
MCLPGVYSLGGDIYSRVSHCTPCVHKRHDDTAADELLGMSIKLRITGIALAVFALAAAIATATTPTVGTVTLLVGAAVGILAHDLISLGEAIKLGVETPYMIVDVLGLKDTFVSDIIKSIITLMGHLKS